MIHVMAPQTNRPPTTVITIAKGDDGTYTIYDALQRTHEAETAAGVGKIVARLIDDPTLPKVEGGPIDHNVSLLSEIAKRITGRVAPEFMPLITAFEPAAHAVADTLAKRPARPRRRRGGNRSGVTRP